MTYLLGHRHLLQQCRDVEIYTKLLLFRGKYVKISFVTLTLNERNLIMGYNISTIKNLPPLSGYYFFLIGEAKYACGMSDVTLYKRFDEIAENIGPNSAIVKSAYSQNINRELVECFRNSEWFEEVYFNVNLPSLIVMKPHPTRFDSNSDHFFLLIPFEELDKIYSSQNELVPGDTHFLDKVVNNKNDAGFFKRVIGSLLLQPNCAGIGFDINKFFEGLREKRMQHFLYHSFEEKDST